MSEPVSTFRVTKDPLPLTPDQILLADIEDLERAAERWQQARRHAEAVLHECGRRLSLKRAELRDQLAGGD